MASKEKSSGEKSNILFLLLLIAGFWIYWLEPWKNHKSPRHPTPVPRSISMVKTSNALAIPVAEAAVANTSKTSETSSWLPTPSREKVEFLPEVILPPGLPKELTHLAQIEAADLFLKKAQDFAKNWDQQVYQKLEKNLESPDEVDATDYVVVKKYKMKDGRMFHRSEYTAGNMSENIYEISEEGGYKEVGGRYLDESGKLRTIYMSASDADVGVTQMDNTKGVEGHHSFSFNSEGALTSSYSSIKNYAFSKEYVNGEIVQKTFTIHATETNPYRPPQEF